MDGEIKIDAGIDTRRFNKDAKKMTLLLRNSGKI